MGLVQGAGHARALQPAARRAWLPRRRDPGDHRDRRLGRSLCAAKSEPRPPVPAWIFGVRNKLKDRARRRHRLPLPRQADAADAPASVDLDELARMDRSRLTARQREAIALLVRGRRIAEIAKILGISWRAAQERIRRALLRLKAAPAREGLERTAWAAAALATMGPAGNPQARTLFVEHVARASHATIARALGMTREAVRCRPRRLRRRCLAPTRLPAGETPPRRRR